VHEDRHPVGEQREELAYACLFDCARGRIGAEGIAKERQQLDSLRLGEKQGVPDAGVGADDETRQQRIVGQRQVGAENRGKGPPQPEILDDEELAPRDAAAAGKLVLAHLYFPARVGIDGDGSPLPEVGHADELPDEPSSRRNLQRELQAGKRTARPEQPRRRFDPRAPARRRERRVEHDADP
jgi:hypothetical protein